MNLQKHLMSFNTFILLSILVLLTNCSSESDYEYSSEARKLLQANERQKAEEIIKAGLVKYPYSSILKSDLFNYYIDTNQWSEAEQYLQVAGVGFPGGEYIIAKVAKHYFEEKDWKKAHKYFKERGDFSVYEDTKNSKCPAVSIEAYRNAAVSARNMSDGYSELKELQTIITNISKIPDCVFC